MQRPSNEIHFPPLTNKLHNYWHSMGEGCKHKNFEDLILFCRGIKKKHIQHQVFLLLQHPLAVMKKNSTLISSQILLNSSFDGSKIKLCILYFKLTKENMKKTFVSTDPSPQGAEILNASFFQPNCPNTHKHFESKLLCIFIYSSHLISSSTINTHMQRYKFFITIK